MAASGAERDELIRKAQEVNQIVYTSKQGTVYRKSDDPRLVDMAKTLDAEREARQRSEAAAHQAQLEKRANELNHLPGDLQARVALLKAIDLLPEADRPKALEMLKAKNIAMETAFKSFGTTQAHTDEVDPLDAMATEIAKRDNISFEQAYNKALNTTAGQKAYEAHVSKRHGAAV